MIGYFEHELTVLPGCADADGLMSIHGVFGAFMDIGGMEGLVPVREISWDKVTNPANYVKAGDYVTVKVLSVDWERDRVSLSIRECQAKPLKPRKADAASEEEPAIDLAAEMAKVNAAGESGFTSGAFDAL